MAMSEWYCKAAAHQDERPCLNHKFMQQARAHCLPPGERASEPPAGAADEIGSQ